MPTTTSRSAESSVTSRYAAAAKAPEAALCCPVEYNKDLLKKHPIANANSFLRAEDLAEDLRVKHPLVPTESVDVVVSSCVLNLVESGDKRQLFQEIFRVLRKGGRAVISDIVSDKDVPPAMQQDPTLWSGCISGALREDQFLKAFEDAGFYGIRLVKRVAVCDKTFQLYSQTPYAEHFEFIEPLVPMRPEEAKPWEGGRAHLRHPRETKGMDYNASIAPSQCCDAGSGC